MVNPPTIAMIRSVAVSSTRSPSCSLTRGSLLKIDTVTSCESSQVDADVCSLMNGAAILKCDIMRMKIKEDADLYLRTYMLLFEDVSKKICVQGGLIIRGHCFYLCKEYNIYKKEDK